MKDTKPEGRKLRDRSKLEKPDYFEAGFAVQASTSKTHEYELNNVSANLDKNEHVPTNLKQVHQSKYRNEWEAAVGKFAG